MSKNTKLFEEAIADAKTLRDTAVANAKAALEESFAPRISAMFEKRMQDLEESEDDEMEEAYHHEENTNLVSEKEDIRMSTNSDDYQMEDVDLEELFNSLSEEDLEETMGTEKEAYAEGEDEMEENYDLEEILRELEEEENAIYEDEDGEMDDLNENEDLEEKASKDEDISEVTVDELRDMIQDAIRDVMGGEGTEAAGEDEMNLDMDLDMSAEDEPGHEDTESEKEKEKEDEEDEDMKEIAALERTLAERRKAKVEKEKAMMERRKYKGSEEDKKDLQEAIRTIKTLRGQLNEVNLLNAKLIYVNRLFKTNNLTEGQKVNIVNSFDKAATLNEAKNVFEILKSTISKSAPKTSLKESKSFASSVIGGRPAAKPIINEDETISRMQRLAGIK
jgi:hypothetical protein